MFDMDKETMNGIGFKTETWTSRSKIALQSPTCHYINKEFELKRLLISMEYFRENRKQLIAKTIGALVKGFKIPDKVNKWCTIGIML